MQRAEDAKKKFIASMTKLDQEIEAEKAGDKDATRLKELGDEKAELEKMAQAQSSSVDKLVKRKEELMKKRTEAYDKRKADNEKEENMKREKAEKVEVIKREIQMREAKKRSASLKNEMKKGEDAVKDMEALRDKATDQKSYLDLDN